MSDEIRIGCIGCGGNARGHMRTLTEMEGARVVATCDVQEGLAQEAASGCGADAYTDHRTMLERSDLDAVYISIPVFAHGAPELDTLDRGLPFFVEKPVAIDMETARRIEGEVKRRRAITCVGYQLRYYGAAALAKEILGGRIVSMVVGKYWSGTGRGDPSRWVRQMARSGGQLLEQATHTIDMMRYLIGEVEEVHAMLANRALPEIDCPDTHVVTLKFEGGALGSLTAYWAYDPRDWSNANLLDILFEDSLLNWSGGGIRITQDGETEERTGSNRSIDEVFVHAVRTGDPSGILSPYSDAVKSLAVSLAANASGAERAVKRVSEMG